MAHGTCSVDGCGRTGRIHLGYCQGHYERVKKYGDPGTAPIAPARVKTPVGSVCAVEACHRPVNCQGWCKAHYTRWERHGDVQADVPIGPAAKDKVRRPKPQSPVKVLARDLICEAPGCGDPQYIKGHCVRHNARIKAYGSLDGGFFEFDPLARPDPSRTKVELFWQRVDSTGRLLNADPNSAHAGSGGSAVTAPATARRPSSRRLPAVRTESHGI